MTAVTVSFYRLDTGLFTGRTYSGDERHLRVPAGDGVVPGEHDHLSRRVDVATGEVVDYQSPAPPDTEFETWAWDEATRRWVASPTIAAHWRFVRAERDRRLRDTDWMALRALEGAGAMTTQWRAYRQALRDITMQPDPLNVAWPEPPA